MGMCNRNVLGLLLCLLTTTFPRALVATERVMNADDLFRLQTIGDVAISPKGDAVAFVVQRPASASAVFGRLYLWGNDRADVWIVSTEREGEARNLTKGDADHSGFWAPQWSPDGERLAMLSTRGGNVRLWVWTRDTGTIAMVSDRGVDSRANSFAWVSGDRLVFWTLPPGEVVPSMEIDHQTPAIAEREWARAFAGKTSTASVLESGISGWRGGQRSGQCQLLLADVRTKDTRVLARTTDYGEFSFATIRVSPNHRSIAFLKQVGVLEPTSDLRRVELLDPIYDLMVVRLDDGLAAARFEGLYSPFWGSLRWSPDSTEIAAIGYGQGLGTQPVLFRCTVVRMFCQPVTNETFALQQERKNAVTAPPYLWFGEHQLAVSGLERNSPAAADEPHERWKITDQLGRLHDLFNPPAAAAETLRQLVPDGCRGGLIASSGDAVWRINGKGVAEGDVAHGLGKITDLERSPADNSNCAALVVATISPGGRRFYALDGKSWHFAPIPQPTKDTTLAAFDEDTRLRVFSVSNDTGLTSGSASMKDRISAFFLPPIDFSRTFDLAN